MISSLRFDNRFKYLNVQINENYHIVKSKKGNREIKDFNPSMETGHGSVGHTFIHSVDIADHQIVSTYDPVLSHKNTHSKSMKFTPVEKRDRPFSKNTHKMT